MGLWAIQDMGIFEQHLQRDMPQMPYDAICCHTLPYGFLGFLGFLISLDQLFGAPRLQAPLKELCEATQRWRSSI
jgi:hypothetical protein